MIPGRSVRPGKGDGLAHRLPIPNMIDEQENEAGVDPMAFGFAQAFVQVYHAVFAKRWVKFASARIQRNQPAIGSAQQDARLLAALVRPEISSTDWPFDKQSPCENDLTFNDALFETADTATALSCVLKKSFTEKQQRNLIG